VEVVGHRVDEGLDERERSADGDAAGQRVADGERDAHVDGGEGEGLGHGLLLVGVHDRMMGAAGQ